MSSLLKCILGLCVVLCFVQFIEMARIARDDAAVKDAAVKDPAADLINNLQNLVGDVVEKLKTAVDSDAVKKLFDDAGKALAETAKSAQEKIGELSQNASKN
ncbi:PREDICTED: uncharacterized protein LOC108370733 [Rhagoletis zephyria]|uniref:uncharacterized protein LOC108370733 n=1 Tax=Rhagoletis zephyria TaxID=28612 RepID=UPI0008114F5E|nr:PREDICTED: uncharacterized protein LOC108370733 [Rhagoletis zephyria]XP_036329281.1 uncharacterized protein LOC118741419 [Rhagoletis pomonella]